MMAHQVHVGSPWRSGRVCQNFSKLMERGFGRGNRCLKFARSRSTWGTVGVHEGVREAWKAGTTWC